VAKTDIEEFEKSLMAQYKSQTKEKNLSGADVEKNETDDEDNEDDTAPSSCMPCGPTAPLQSNLSLVIMTSKTMH
jgi:hypothetical protein